jgi:hypothetical protein
MGAGKYMRIPNLENIPQVSSTLSHEGADAATTSKYYNEFVRAQDYFTRFRYCFRQ